MNTGPIQRISRDRLEQRHDFRLPAAWIGLERTPPPRSRGQWLSEDNTSPATAPRDSPVLIMFSTPSGPAYQAMLAHGQAGARVYALVPAGWEPKDQAVTRCPRVLIRRLPEVPATGVHTASGAHIWMGATLGGATPWRLRLGADQAAAYRQVFLRLFWHEATDEAFSGGQRLSFRAAGDRPFDVPELTRNAPVRLVSPSAQLDAVTGGGLTHLTTSSPPQGQPAHLWLPPSGDHHRGLASLTRGGAQVRWRDRSLPDLAIQGSSGTALLPGTKHKMRIELTREQAADAAALLQQDGSWTFRESIRLGDHAHDGAQIWLKDAAAPHPVEAEQRIALSDVQAAELRAVLSAAPGSWPNPQPLALTTRYRWTVLPPRLPAGATEDALIGRWKNVDADWESRLSKAREALEAAEESRGRIGRAFSKLMSAMMGFQRTQAGLLLEISTLNERSPSDAGPVNAPGLFARLERLEEQAGKLISDLDEAERKAREDAEREKQETQWRREVEAARKALPELRAEVAEAKAARPDIDERFAAVNTELKSASKKTKRSLVARRGKLTEERNLLVRRLQRLTDDIASFEQAESAPFTFTAPPQQRNRSKVTGGRFVPARSRSKTPTDAPGEALPDVGVLRTHMGERYLVIDRWAQLELGEQAASRLNAKLVAPEDA